MQSVLITGASGLFGRRAAEAFTAAGWEVRRYQRGSDMVAAAAGVDVIVNAMNPPNYHNWAQLIPQITAQVIAAARASGARVILPGNVYGFGQQPGPWGPGVVPLPCTRKGAIRLAMEAEYRASGLPVIVLRGGDFLDPEGRTLMAMLMRNWRKGRIASMGMAEVWRAYGFLPDMARLAVALAERRAELPRFADIPYAGLSFSMEEWRAEVARQAGRPMRLTKFPWWLMRLASPVWELARELLEMRYLYNLPHRLDPAPLAALLPEFRSASLAEVVAAHLKHENKG